MRKLLTHHISNILNWIWKLKLLPKINVFLWLVKDALCTCNFLFVMEREFPNRCHLCNKNIENINHIFKECPFAQSIWTNIPYNCPTPFLYDDDFLSWLEMIHKNYKIKCKLFNYQMKKIGIIIWNVWNHRN